ncbi:hypothetical protein WME90_24465 [Sorangium sp. So ce375]|uniref:carboxypeptidase-like regulatory domain-containing protein n=1 Tax=Sorangium sp. So ce375 TaxID=3133306 RepID=UPI003F5C0342
MKIAEYTRLAAQAAAVALPLVALGCGPDPEKVGDECAPDDGCPNGLVCAEGGEDHICYAPPGASCDAGGTDYCLGDAVCGEDGTCRVPPGGSCAGDTKDFCAEGATCGADATCQIPPGGACDPAGPDLCLDDAVCGKTRDGGGICGIAEGGECDPEAPLCAGGLTCAELVAGGHACYPPVLAQGNVFDSESTSGIEGALVLALDDQATAITDVTTTDAAGNYVLEVPVPRTENGAPIEDVIFTLRASAQDYQPFPGGLRTALPIASSEATSGEDGWTIATALTDIALIALPEDQRGLPSISGSVRADEQSGGVLVVAEDGDGKGFSAVTDRGGAYTIFNVPAGSYAVSGYAAGLALDPKSAEVGDAALTGVDLARSDAALGSLSGTINIVNAPGGSTTSVVLVVASTFNDTFVRGEVPRGLRTPLSGPPDVSGEFSVAGVPAGNYVVLAAFENDGLVRDPDPNIAGTQLVTVEMPSPGEDVSLPTSFKITEALPVIGPGATDPEPVTGAPTLRWGDDASEDFYTVDVYNAYGDLVWCLGDDPTCAGANVPGSSGGAEVSVEYGGPLEPGMYYQFRVTSWRSPGGSEPGAISATEDLRGVFYAAGQ